MLRKRTRETLWLCLLYFTAVIINCDIIDNTTQRSVAEQQRERRESRSKTNATTPVFSTRSNFISASTVLNPPPRRTSAIAAVTEPSDWTLKKFRDWAKYSSKADKVLKYPNAGNWIQDFEVEKEEAKNELEDVPAESDEFTEKTETAATTKGELSTYYIFKNEDGQEMAITLGTVADHPDYYTKPKVDKEVNTEKHQDYVEVEGLSNASEIGSVAKIRNIGNKDVEEDQHDTTMEINEQDFSTAENPQNTVAPPASWTVEVPESVSELLEMLESSEENQSEFTPGNLYKTEQTTEAMTSTLSDSLEELRKIYARLEERNFSSIQENETNTKSREFFEDFLRDGKIEVNATGSALDLSPEDWRFSTPTKEPKNLTPVAEALHSPPTEASRNVTTVGVGDNTIQVSQEPVRRDSLLETLTDVQFSWVDVIIAICCTAAVLLILINIGVCVQYCVQKRSRLKRFRPYTVPLTSTLRMRIDSLRLRTPGLRNRPWLSSHRSLFGRCEPQNCIWPEGGATNSNDRSGSSSPQSAQPSTDVSISTSRSNHARVTNVTGHAATSFHDSVLHHTMPSFPNATSFQTTTSLPNIGASFQNVASCVVAADKGTQYESTDAMIANFVNSDLIVELNDRDSTCTSLSEGFTFSRDYGAPKPLYSSVTDL